MGKPTGFFCLARKCCNKSFSSVLYFAEFKFKLMIAMNKIVVIK